MFIGGVNNVGRPVLLLICSGIIFIGISTLIGISISVLIGISTLIGISIDILDLIAELDFISVLISGTLIISDIVLVSNLGCVDYDCATFKSEKATSVLSYNPVPANALCVAEVDKAPVTTLVIAGITFGVTNVACID